MCTFSEHLVSALHKEFLLCSTELKISLIMENILSLQEGRPIVQTKEENDTARSRDYNALLEFSCGGASVTIPDPQKVATGWISEKVCCTFALE